MFGLYYCSLSSGLGLLVCGLFFLLREVIVLLKKRLTTQHVVKQYLIILRDWYSCYLLRLWFCSIQVTMAIHFHMTMCFDVGKDMKKGNRRLSVQGGITQKEEKKSWEMEQLCRLKLLRSAALVESWIHSRGGLDADSQWGRQCHCCSS